MIMECDNNSRIDESLYKDRIIKKKKKTNLEEVSIEVRMFSAYN